MSRYIPFIYQATVDVPLTRHRDSALSKLKIGRGEFQLSTGRKTYPMFLWPWGAYDPDAPTESMFRSDFLLGVSPHIPLDSSSCLRLYIYIDEFLHVLIRI